MAPFRKELRPFDPKKRPMKLTGKRNKKILRSKSVITSNKKSIHDQQTYSDKMETNQQKPLRDK